MAQVNVRNRKRTDGSNNWEYRFEIAKQDGKRKRISKSGFKTKAEALKEGTRVFNEYNNGGTVLKPSEIGFSDFLDLYIEKYCKHELAIETVASYEKKIRLYIKPALGNYKLKAINPIILSDLFQDLKDKGYSKNTLVSVKAVLSGALTYAVTPLQYIQQSPMVYVKLPKESDKQKKQNTSGGIRKDGKKNGAIRGSNSHIYIKKDWIDKIFDKFPQGHPDHIPLLTGYKLGTRIGETYALTVDDFDFKNKTVTINKQFQWNASKKCWYLKPPKYNSIRTISIPDDYAQEIKAAILQTKKNRLFYGEFYTKYYLNNDNELNENGDGKEIYLINVRENGTFINPRTMQHCSHIIHHNMGFQEFDYHSLRHTHATDLAKAGANPKFVQARLGHKSIKVTMEIYQHLDAEMEQQGADVLNRMYK